MAKINSVFIIKIIIKLIGDNRTKAKVVDIEGVGKAIFGKADGASIEEILNSIKEDIVEPANESEDYRICYRRRYC